MACKGKKRKMSAGGILSSTASGLTAGASFGPVGMGVGAVAGLGLGMYQHIKEQEALERQKKVQSDMLRRNNMLANTDFTYANPMELMPYGGMVPSETVELERGEPYMMPNGNMGMISPQAPAHSQGGVPITLPAGTEVLGKKKIMDDKTFKEIGSKIVRQQRKFNKIKEDHPNRIAERTADLMLNKLNKQFEGLFQMQGEDTGNYQMADGGKINTKGNASKWRKGDNGLKTYGDVLGTTGYDYFSQNPAELIRFQRYANLPQQDNIYGPGTAEAFDNLGDSFYGFGPESKSGIIPTATPQAALQGGIQNPVATGQPIVPTLNELQNTTNSINPSIGNIGNMAGSLASLAPVAYNILQGIGPQESLNATELQNPYNEQVRRTMANRRYNVQPELEANRLAQATYYRNLMEGAPSQAQYLGGLQAGQISTQRANAAALARKQNVDNDYLAQQAQMDANLGRDIASTNRYVEDVNARTKAAGRQMVGTGLSQLGQFAQNQQLMNNQMIRDAQKLNLLPALVQNFTLNQDGTWKFKQTGEDMTNEQAWGIINGTNIR